jgi:hypothetical protein
MALYDNTAIFTSVPGHTSVCLCHLFKVIQLLAACLKTFRAKALSKFIGFDHKVAAPAEKLVLRYR